MVVLVNWPVGEWTMTAYDINPAYAGVIIGHRWFMVIVIASDCV